jgi:hypothetical protein
MGADQPEPMQETWTQLTIKSGLCSSWRSRSVADDIFDHFLQVRAIRAFRRGPDRLLDSSRCFEVAPAPQ